MINWVKGDLKIRGTKDNIKRFLMEGLEPISNESYVNITSSNSSNNVRVLCDDAYEFITYSNLGKFYIKDTERNFINSSKISAWINEWESNFEGVVVLENYEAAWEIIAQDLSRVSGKFNIDFKILGFEKDQQFNQDIEVIKGEVIKDKKKKFKNYDWECIRPHL